MLVSRDFMLLVLVALWGTSFMFTAISVATIDPVSVVFYRIALGALVLALVIWARGNSLPLEWRAWAGFGIMAIAGNALPFFLIAWGQQSVDSGVAGMIMADGLGERRPVEHARSLQRPQGVEAAEK